MIDKRPTSPGDDPGRVARIWRELEDPWRTLDTVLADEDAHAP